MILAICNDELIVIRCIPDARSTLWPKTGRFWRFGRLWWLLGAWLVTLWVLRRPVCHRAHCKLWVNWNVGQVNWWVATFKENTKNLETDNVEIGVEETAQTSQDQFILGNLGEFWGRSGGNKRNTKCGKMQKSPIDGCGDNDRSSSSSFLEITCEHKTTQVTFQFQILRMAAHGCTCCWLVFFCRITPIFLSRFCRRGLLLLSTFSSWPRENQQ